MATMKNTFATYPPHLVPLLYDGNRPCVIVYADTDDIHVRDGVVHYLWKSLGGTDPFHTYLNALYPWHVFDPEKEFMMLCKDDSMEAVLVGDRVDVEEMNDWLFNQQWKTELERGELRSLLLDLRKKEKVFRTEDMKRKEKDERAKKIVEHLTWVRNEVVRGATPGIQ
jgi:hypothetical protein